MKISNKILFLTALLCTSITACNGSQPEPELEPDNTVDVFFLSGQSNMEGSTFFDNGKDWLKKACEKLSIDSTPMFNGYDNILMSSYGYYPYGGSDLPHATYPKKDESGKTISDSEYKKLALQGYFVPTKVGQGNTDNYMGPEIGIAHVLNDLATSERPIYLIKCAFSGSGFAANDPNWILEGDPRTDHKYNASKNLYENKVKIFTENSLALIKATGKDPVVKAFLWHQGESDTSASQQYEYSMKALIQRFRNDFASYAPEQNGENIAFIDGYIYDGPSSPYGNGATSLNNVKQKIAEDGDNNYIVNTSYKQTYGYSIDANSAAMKCAINYDRPDGNDKEGGVGPYHYKTYDELRLGMGYGGVIKDIVLKK